MADERAAADTFRQMDAIMEPTIFHGLHLHMASGGEPETAVDAICASYSAEAQTANLLAECLLTLGDEASEVEKCVEEVTNDLLISQFQPRLSDLLIESEEVPEWLAETVKFPSARDVFYKLAEKHPDCALLSLLMKMICDSENFKEIPTSVASNQPVQVFMQVLCAQLPHGNSRPLRELVLSSERNYFLAQSILKELSAKSSAAKRLSEEITMAALSHNLPAAHVDLALRCPQPHEGRDLVRALLAWLTHTLKQPDFFVTHTETTPPHFCFIDEVVTTHYQLHDRALTLVGELLQISYDVDELAQLAVKRALLDRLVHLATQGAALEVLTYISRRWRESDLDKSLIRYFVLELIEVAGPPFSPPFSAALTQLLADVVPQHPLLEQLKGASC